MNVNSNQQARAAAIRFISLFAAVCAAAGVEAPPTDPELSPESKPEVFVVVPGLGCVQFTTDAPPFSTPKTAPVYGIMYDVPDGGKRIYTGLFDDTAEAEFASFAVRELVRMRMPQPEVFSRLHWYYEGGPGGYLGDAPALSAMLDVATDALSSLARWCDGYQESGRKTGFAPSSWPEAPAAGMYTIGVDPASPGQESTVKVVIGFDGAPAEADTSRVGCVRSLLGDVIEDAIRSGYYEHGGEEAKARIDEAITELRHPRHYGPQYNPRPSPIHTPLTPGNGEAGTRATNPVDVDRSTATDPHIEAVKTATKHYESGHIDIYGFRDSVQMIVNHINGSEQDRAAEEAAAKERLAEERNRRMRADPLHFVPANMKERAAHYDALLDFIRRNFAGVTIPTSHEMGIAKTIGEVDPNAEVERMNADRDTQAEAANLRAANQGLKRPTPPPAVETPTAPPVTEPPLPGADPNYTIVTPAAEYPVSGRAWEGGADSTQEKPDIAGENGQ